jgi:hypothetical protein
MRNKIIEHAKSGYSSSPHEFSDLEISIIIENNCKCAHCGKSIFEMDDFPEVLENEREVLCEDCYDEEYRTYCPLCEDSFEKDDITEYFFISKETSKEVHKPIGMYKILKYPFYYGDCLSGFDDFFDDAIEKVSDLDIQEAYSMINSDNRKDIMLDCICPNCAEKYTRRDFFIKAEPKYCILMKNERNSFSDYTEERLHQIRQDMIHRRITLRGMLQKANK